MDRTADLTEIEQQLLMAAAVHGLGTGTDLGRANTARIVDQVLAWRGLSGEQVRSGCQGEECDPTHDLVYSALIRMIHQKHREGPGRAPGRPGPALFEGGGNWGVPGDPDFPACSPRYNSCRLTAEGERLARLLLEGHSECRRSAT